MLKTAWEYLDRGATWAMVAAAIVLVAVRRSARLNEDERRTVRFGLAWFVLMFVVTVFVPVRSSLYAVAPSVGSALVAAAFASRAHTEAP